MKYQVSKVLLNDITPGAENAPHAVTLIFSDEDYEFQPNGEVEVWIERADLSLSEVRQQAISKAREFLTKALAALDQQS